MTEVAIPDDKGSEVVSGEIVSQTYLPAVNQTFDDLMEQNSLWTFDSEDLIDKSLLHGVPHVITEIAYRYAEFPDPADAKKVLSTDYVSVTARVGTAAWLEKAAARQSRLGFAFPEVEPESLVVYNDGSTGIRRQLTTLLHQAKIIDVGHEENKELSRFDTRFYDWIAPETVNADGEIKGVTISDNHGKPLVIQVLKGLRLSEYPYGTTVATTWYLS